MHRYESAFIRLVAEAAGIAEDEVRPLLRTAEGDKGDLAIPCFPFAKRLKKNPALIAKEIAGAATTPPEFSKIEAAGPYLNAFIDGGHLVRDLISEIRDKKERFCQSAIGGGQTVLVEYSSPNIAKPLAFHHLRSTMIGNCLAQIFSALGYDVHRINYVGDWGKTFGLLAEAYRRFGDESKLEAGGIAYLLELYVEANKAKAEDPAFDEAARGMFRLQEEGDETAIELWRRIRRTSIDEFKSLYERLGVAFDSIEGESDYKDKLEAVISEIEKVPGTREDQGALLVDIPYSDGEAPIMLKKSDGATLYATRDIAAAVDRFERFAFAKSLYVVGSEQRQYFEQLKRVLSAMGHSWSEKMTHIQFGRVKGMSTRAGNVVFLEEVLDEARERALAKMQETAGDRDLDLESVSEQVGIGGVVFGDLKNLRTSDYSFDWDELLNPRGFTGICVQYAHARCCSILRKGGGAPPASEVAYSDLAAPEEIALVKELARLPGAVEAAAEHLEPSRLARTVYDVAHAWNRYQQAGNADKAKRILVEDEALRGARLALVDAARIGLAEGLKLLGVPTPEAM